MDVSILEAFDEELKELKEKGVSFDLEYLRKRLWEIADENNLDGGEVFKQYMDWKSKQSDKKQYTQEI